MPLGCEHDSHRPDKVNFSRLRVRTRSLVAGTSTIAPAAIDEDISFHTDVDVMETMPSEEHPECPQNYHPMHVTGIQETNCDK